MKSEVIVADGRRLGFHQYGSRSAEPVFYFHGFPGSRLDGYLLDLEQHAWNSNSRIIAIDRPGIGLSDDQPDRTLLDWPRDVRAVADALHITKFSIIGFSGGGPYALACAYAMSDRLLSVVFVSGMGPYALKESRKDAAMSIPRLWPFFRQLTVSRLYRSAMQNPLKLVERRIEVLAKEDQDFLLANENVNKLRLTMVENFRQGKQGFLKEAEIYRQPWNFQLTDISVKVHIWQGTSDRSVSARTAKRVLGEIPNARIHIVSGEGHFSLAGKYLTNILQTLHEE